MAVGTVSGLNLDEEWQLIGSQALSGLSTTTFSSISGYKKLRIVFKAIKTTAGADARVRFNGDSTDGNYNGNLWWQPGGSAAYEQSTIPLESYGYSTQNFRSGYITVEDVNKSLPHTVDGTSFTAYLIKGMFFDGNPITSVTFYNSVATTFTTGTVYLYGIAA